MKYWRELPYRGDGEPRDKKPRRRFVNLKKERRDIVVSVMVVFLLVLLIDVLYLFTPASYDKSKTTTAVITISFVFALTFAIGILSISRFRKGYDIDISNKPRGKKRRRSTKDKNLID